MRYSIRFIVALFAAITCFAEPIYMTIPNIPGEVVQKGREGTLQVFALNHEIVSPRDSASGLPTGKRQHQPFRCVFTQGRSTPLLFKALTDNQIIPKVEIRFYKPSQTTGVETLYYTIELQNVSVASVRPWMANIKDANVLNYGTQVECSFTYQKIVWTYADGGVTHEDSWDTGVR